MSRPVDIAGELVAVAAQMRNRAHIHGHANASHLHGVADTLEELADKVREQSGDACPWGGNPDDLGELGALIDRLLIVPVRDIRVAAKTSTASPKSTTAVNGERNDLE